MANGRDIVPYAGHIIAVEATDADTVVIRIDSSPLSAEEIDSEVVHLHEDRRNRRQDHVRRWLFRGMDELRRQQKGASQHHPDRQADLDCSV